MKRYLIILLALFTFSAQGQVAQPDSVSQGGTSFTPQFNYKGIYANTVGLQIRNPITGKFYGLYTGFQSDQRFAKLVGNNTFTGGTNTFGNYVFNGFGSFNGDVYFNPSSNGVNLQNGTPLNFYNTDGTKRTSLTRQTDGFRFTQNNNPSAGGFLFKDNYDIYDEVNGKRFLKEGDVVSGTNGKGTLGTIYAAPPSAAKYTQGGSGATFSYTVVGANMNGGDGTSNNYIEYPSYWTNASNWTRQATATIFSNSTSNAGFGLGNNSTNGRIIGKFIVGGANNGKVSIETYRSATNYVRVTSTASLPYSIGDSIQVTFKRSLMNYTVTAKNIKTGAIVNANWVDDLTYPTTILSAWNAAHPAIYQYGNNIFVKRDSYVIDDYKQNALLIYGNSIAAGAYVGGQENMVYSLIRKDIPDGVTLIAGGGNTTTDYMKLRPEIFSLQPKAILWCDGINDIVSGIPTDTTKARIQIFINDCISRGITPIINTVSPVGSSLTGTGKTNADIRNEIIALNTYILALPVQTNDTYTPMQSGGILLAAYNCGDDIHHSGAGAQQYATSTLIGAQAVLERTSPRFLLDDRNVVTTFLVNNWSSGTGTAAQVKVGTGKAGQGAQLIKYSPNWVTTGNGYRANAAVLLNSDGKLVLNSVTNQVDILAQSFNADAPQFHLTSDSLALSVQQYSTSTANSLFANRVTNSGTGTSTRAGYVVGNGIATGSIITYGRNNTDAPYLQNKFIVATDSAGVAIGSFKSTGGGVEFMTGGNTSTNVRGKIFNNGNWRIGDNNNATARLHLRAGSATAGTSPLKIDGGTLLGTTEAGAIENDGTNIYYTATNGGARQRLNAQGTITNVSSSNSDIGVATGTTTPVLTLNSGTGANQIVKRDGSGNLNATTVNNGVYTNASNVYTNSNWIGVDGTTPDASGAFNITRSSAGGNKSYQSWTKLGAAQYNVTIDANNNWALGTTPGRGLNATVDTLTFLHNGNTGATEIKRSNGTSLFAIKGNTGYMKAKLPAYSSGTALSVVYNSTNDQFETSTSAGASYEEGSWTPTTTATPAVGSVGKYTKIGNLVTAYFKVSIASNSSTTNFIISGLPYSNSTNSIGTGSVAVTDIGIPITVYVSSGISAIQFKDYSNVQIIDSQMSAKTLSGTVTYSTTN